MCKREPSHPIARARGNHESFAAVRHAQAVLMVVSSGVALERRDAGERFVEVVGGK
jgi:hypothetical protein